MALADGSHGLIRQVMPVLNYTLAFALQLRKSKENLNQVSRAVKATGCADLAVF
jgi:hypothetical protein